MTEKDNSHKTTNSEYRYGYHSSKSPSPSPRRCGRFLEHVTSILTRRVGGKYFTALFANADTHKNHVDSVDFINNTPTRGGRMHQPSGIFLYPQYVAVSWAKNSRWVIFGVTCVLYVMNQRHLLPTQLSSVVSKALFWPTLPITYSRRIGRWRTIVDDTVVIGGVPFFKDPERLYENYDVRGVINMCEEYVGPMKEYNRLGIEQLHLPTIDHTQPSFEDMRRAVEFIADYEANDKGRVYVHCKAGHGRSAAIVYAWLLSKAPDISVVDMEALNKMLCKKRNVRKTLWKQSNINDFRFWLSSKKNKKNK